MGYYDRAKEIINKKLNVLKDKSGWAVSIQVLCLLIHFEKNDTKAFKSSAQVLHKFVRYHDKKINISFRDRIISDTLMYIANALADNEVLITDQLTLKSAAALKNKINANLKLLSSKKYNYEWEPFAHELIRFDKWLASRLIGN